MTLVPFAQHIDGNFEYQVDNAHPHQTRVAKDFKIETYHSSYDFLALNPLYMGNPFTNSQDPDEMLHDAAFHQSL